jgi:hypothetical protein
VVASSKDASLVKVVVTTWNVVMFRGNNLIEARKMAL